MRKWIILAFIVLLGLLQGNPALAQPTEIWEKTFYYAGGNYAGEAIAFADDGGYFIVANEVNYGGILLIKVDENGNEQWNSLITGLHQYWATAITRTTDGYLIVGHTQIFNPTISDIYLAKLDLNGVKQWEKTFDGGMGELGLSIVPIDVGFMIVGCQLTYATMDVYLVVLDDSGNLVWSKAVGGPDYEMGMSAIQTYDGNYLIVGSKEAAGSTDLYLVKIDISGNIVWEKTFGGAGNDIGYSIASTHDGGYIIVGYTESFGAGGKDVYLIRIDDNGNKQWEKTFGGANWDVGYTITNTIDGGFVAAGFTTSFGAGGRDVYLVRIDADGNRQWEKTFGSSDSEDAVSMLSFSGGCVLIGGIENSSGGYGVYLLRVEWDSDLDGLSNEEEINLGTDPFNADSDGDNLIDSEEIQIGTDPTNIDSDGDGLYDGEEVKQFTTNPLASDSDGDGLTDYEEVMRGTNPSQADTDGDFWNDKLDPFPHLGLLPNGLIVLVVIGLVIVAIAFRKRRLAA